jgi:hypothetical protein
MFVLTYAMNGMTYGDVEDMLSTDRVWYVKRLEEQIKKESEEVKKAQKSPKKAPRAGKGRRG